MLDAIARPPVPVNEPVLSYAPGSTERVQLKRSLAELGERSRELPMVIAGREVTSSATAEVRAPHAHARVLGRLHKAQPAHVAQAIAAARDAHGPWSRLPWQHRAAVFLRAAELLAGRYRPVLNAATMLGQSKTAYQAEIDSACELIDFLRFNVHFLSEILAQQPIHAPGIWNMTDVRPLEGFVFAVTPFNFTAIAGNLPAAPALMGNTVVWKPASTQAFSAHFIMELFREAGLPDGVINLVHGDGADVGDPVLASPDLAGLHFTGSTATFNALWSSIGARIGSYRTYPRIVGETGGKDFIVAHASADVDALAVAIARGGFEYQGQKCSAPSRVYVPDTLWPAVRERVADMMCAMRVGDVEDFRNFMGAVIDAKAFAKHKGYLTRARQESGTYTVIQGGSCDDREGYFVQPTLIETNDPRATLMVEEIFGPVVTAYVYKEREYEEALALCDITAPYALTGAVFARDRAAIERASTVLRHAAGNFYINDKPTGAVVGQQPFGGARASGTNDKAGSALNLLRWASPRTIKENLAPPHEWAYPFMAET